MEGGREGGRERGREERMEGWREGEREGGRQKNIETIESICNQTILLNHNQKQH